MFYHFKAGLIQLLVFCIYLLGSFVFFVFQKNANPIGTGIIQYTFIGVHVIFILIYWVVINPSALLRQTFIRVLASLTGLLLGILLYNYYGTEVWDFFWKVREQ
jgi:hypothetical protein